MASWDFSDGSRRLHTSFQMDYCFSNHFRSCRFQMLPQTSDETKYSLQPAFIRFNLIRLKESRWAASGLWIIWTRFKLQNSKHRFQKIIKILFMQSDSGFKNIICCWSQIYCTAVFILQIPDSSFRFQTPKSEFQIQVSDFKLRMQPPD